MAVLCVYTRGHHKRGRHIRLSGRTMCIYSRPSRPTLRLDSIITSHHPNSPQSSILSDCSTRKIKSPAPTSSSPSPALGASALLPFAIVTARFRVTSKSVPNSGSRTLAIATRTAFRLSTPSLPLEICEVPTQSDAHAKTPLMLGNSCAVRCLVVSTALNPDATDASLIVARSSKNQTAAPSASLGPTSTLSKTSKMTLSSRSASVHTSWLSGTGRKSLTSIHRVG
mmetsp:Transcript_11310/g.41935  ORF Transcript_11310/g.41935 Transcript_11310/m.41935 type:complete len:226 (+) Transcript_11310:3494-4171(+)